MDNKKLKKLLKKVRQDFPEIKWKIPIEYSENIADVATLFDYFDDKGKIGIFGVKIIVSANPDIFYNVSDEEKKGVLAHELGHLERITKMQSVHKLDRITNWTIDFKEIMKNYKAYLTLDITKDWAMRHINRYLLEEMYADKQAAIRGYGGGLLSYLERFNLPGSFFDQRIKKLEKTLNNL